MLYAILVLVIGIALAEVVIIGALVLPKSPGPAGPGGTTTKGTT